MKASRIDKTNNFNAIRYIMAFLIMLLHFKDLHGYDFWFPLSSYYYVCGFFIISGFFVYSSFNRAESWRQYLRNRAWRIFPSYFIVVVAAAVMLVAVSNLPAWEYFTDSRWVKYLIFNLLTLNFIQPELPGVFESNPIAAVNGSLWTMKIEVGLYLFIIPIILLTRKYSIRFWKVFLAIYIFSVAYKWVFTALNEATGRDIYAFMAKQTGGQLSFFYSGVMLSMVIDKLKRHSRAIAAVSFALFMAGILWFMDREIYTMVLFPMVLSCLIVSLAYTGRWGRWADTFESCSYEIYLFHFPIIQLAEHFHLPERIGGIATFAAIVMVTCATAYVVARYVSSPLSRAYRRNPKILANQNFG